MVHQAVGLFEIDYGLLLLCCIGNFGLVRAGSAAPSLSLSIYLAFTDGGGRHSGELLAHRAI